VWTISVSGPTKTSPARNALPINPTGKAPVSPVRETTARICSPSAEAARAYSPRAIASPSFASREVSTAKAASSPLVSGVV